MKQFTAGSALLSFVNTVEHGSFAAAARAMNVSPAALGQGVDRLEKHLGVRLLNRTTRRMSLTPEGRMLIERAREPLRAIEEIGRMFAENRKTASGPLRISAPVGIARHQLVPLVAGFVAAYPDVQVEIDASDEVRDFAQGRVDVGFRIMTPEDSSIIARPIAWLQAPTLASPAYLKANGTPAQPRDLLQHKCIGYRYPNSERIAPLRFRRGGKDFELSFRPSLIVNDVEIACEAAVAGLGIVQPPVSYARGHIESGLLVPLLSRFEAKPWRIYLCYADRREMPLRVRAFIDFAFAWLRRDARDTAPLAAGKR